MNNCDFMFTSDAIIIHFQNYFKNINHANYFTDISVADYFIKQKRRVGRKSAEKKTPGF